MTQRRPGSVELTPVGLTALRAVIEQFLAVGNITHEFHAFPLKLHLPFRRW